jgi:cytochrome c oxidase subunit 2
VNIPYTAETRSDTGVPNSQLGLDVTNPAGKDDVITANQLHLPVGRPAIMQLSSKDVVHSFALPQMRVKQDAFPGVVHPVWFMPTETGEWDIVCSQLCGLAHHRMRGFYTIQSQADFDAWLAEERFTP